MRLGDASQGRVPALWLLLLLLIISLQQLVDARPSAGRMGHAPSCAGTARPMLSSDRFVRKPRIVIVSQRETQQAKTKEHNITYPFINPLSERSEDND